MNWKTLIIFIFAIILIIGVGLAAYSLIGPKKPAGESTVNLTTPTTPKQYWPLDRSEKLETESETIGALTVYKAVNDWQLVENSEVGFSIKVPVDWEISGEVSKYDFKAAWNSEKASMAVDVYSYDNKSKITPVEWARNGGLKQFLPISVAGVSGVRYITKVAYEAIFDEGVSEVEDSYIVGLILPQGDIMIDISCFVIGVDFELYKPKCDELINTFSLTE